MSAGHHGALGGEGENKQIAILIAILALLLALAEVGAKGSQTSLLNSNIKASNLWSFYQAKTIRQTVLKTASEQLTVEQLAFDDVKAADTKVKAAMEKRIADWQADVVRYESEPKVGGGEGRKELRERAIAEEKNFEYYSAKFHKYEYASSAFQIAIVVGSAYLITHVLYLLWGSLALGGFGVLFLLAAQFVSKV